MDNATKCQFLREFLESSGLGPLLPPKGSRDPSSDFGHEPARSISKGGGSVTYFEVEGGFHDLNHDLRTPECLGHILAWLRDQTAPESQ